jgi:hypothetical protein
VVQLLFNSFSLYFSITYTMCHGQVNTYPLTCCWVPFSALAGARVVLFSAVVHVPHLQHGLIKSAELRAQQHWSIGNFVEAGTARWRFNFCVYKYSMLLFLASVSTFVMPSSCCSALRWWNSLWAGTSYFISYPLRLCSPRCADVRKTQ